MIIVDNDIVLSNCEYDKLAKKCNQLQLQLQASKHNIIRQYFLGFLGLLEFSLCFRV